MGWKELFTIDTFHSIIHIAPKVNTQYTEGTFLYFRYFFASIYPSLYKVVVRCKTSYTGLFSFLAIPLLMGDIMIEFMNMIDINGITTITLLVVIVLSPQLRS